MMWTKEQQLAIDIRQQNVIVSAGAGSGKTAVLTERAFQILKNKEANIDELLILTFTNAAAHEMKDRIRMKLKDAKLFEIADQVEGSNITTFDAYALSLVKKMHLMLNISPNVSIIDESIIKVERRRIIDELFNEYYSNKHPKFLKMIYTFCPKNDNSIKEFVEDILDASELAIDKDLFLSDFIKNTISLDLLTNMTNEVVELVRQRFFEAKEMLNIMENLIYIDKTILAIDKIVDASTYDAMFNELQNFKFPTGKLEEQDKEIRDQIKNYLKDFTNKVLSLGTAEDIKRCYFNPTILDSLEVLLALAKATDERLKKFKKMHNAFTFHDIAKLALEITQNKKLAEEIKSSIKYIMIDEYQDTSDIQDAFISAIGNHNIFMVGDTKQSIYRFRNANCAIFQGKYNAYKANNGGTKIDLNKNFRSRVEVIDNLNKMFSVLMSEKIGGVNYRLDHVIEHGNKRYNEEGKTLQDQNLEIFSYENETFTTSDTQYEAKIIAQDIIKKITGKYQVFDGKKGIAVTCNYKDFAILIDRKSVFEEFLFVFNQYGIPLKIYKEELIATTQVGAVINSLINFLICHKEKRYDAEFKHAFVSLARSYLFLKTDQEIYDTIQNNAIFASEIYQTITKLDDLSKGFSLSVKLSYLVKELDMYSKLILIGDIETNMQNIDSLIKTTKMIEGLGYSLSDFYQYLKSLEKLKINLTNQDESEVNNVVKVMSIHKSKGLEFNIVYFPLMHKSFISQDNKSSFLISNIYGISMPIVEEENDERTSIQSLLIKEREHQENLSERIRLFYVALTRTKEKMIVLINKTKQRSIHTLNNANSFLDLFSYLDLMNVEFKDTNQIIDPKILIDKSTKTIDEVPHVTIFNTPKAIKELPISSRATKETILVEDEYLRFGNELHYLMELVDFKTKDTSFIVDEKQRRLIQSILELDIFNVKESMNVYKEYSFIDETNNTRGIIDLMIEYNDEIKIIDYKTKNLNKEEYIDQLKTYEKYIFKIFNKKVSLYLVSFIDQKYIKIN